MKLLETEKIPIKIWLDNMEEGALAQAKNLANLPFAFSHIAIMPDSHQGYGMPIGGVMATKGVIIPNAVGVDIGCGMCAVKTTLTDIDTETLKIILGKIKEFIPVGFNRQAEKQDISLMPIESDDYKQYVSFGEVIEREYESALTQLGTLGGGNHFIEIQKGSDNHIWIMIHSGSRNLGKQVADHYNKLAIKENEESNKNVPKEWQLSSFPVESENGQNYIREMRYCIDFALANRKLMMDRVMLIFQETIDDVFGGQPGVDFDPMINIAHNYASLENHYGENVWIHRKGATLATKDTIGIIPGSQGTKSYIVKGKGNPESFNSCSHGAGRKLRRKAAERELNFKEEVEALDKKGILHSIRTKEDLDEAPGAYKNIDTVMENQKDLVEILVELQPLAVIKG